MSIEKLKAAYEAVTKATWRYDEDVSAIVYVQGYKVKAAADFGRIDNPKATAEFITLAHGTMPDLLEAVELLEDIQLNVNHSQGDALHSEGYLGKRITELLAKLKGQP